MPFGKNFK